MTGSARTVWDAAAEDYDRHRRDDVVYAACVRAAADAVGSNPSGIALDCGAGTGLVSERLAPRFAAVVAVDYSRRSLWALALKQTGALLVQADARRLPFRSSVFQAVVCANTLQHLSPHGGQQAAARELERVRAGPLSVTAHHWSRWKQRAGWPKVGAATRPAPVDFIARMTAPEMRALFPRARVRGIGFDTLAGVPMLGGILNDLSGRCLGSWAARRGAGHMLHAIAWR